MKIVTHYEVVIETNSFGPELKVTEIERYILDCLKGVEINTESMLDGIGCQSVKYIQPRGLLGK
jgi:hypothetical protein